MNTSQNTMISMSFDLALAIITNCFSFKVIISCIVGIRTLPEYGKILVECKNLQMVNFVLIALLSFVFILKNLLAQLKLEEAHWWVNYLFHSQIVHICFVDVVRLISALLSVKLMALKAIKVVDIPLLHLLWPIFFIVLGFLAPIPVILATRASYEYNRLVFILLAVLLELCLLIVFLLKCLYPKAFKCERTFPYSQKKSKVIKGYEEIGILSLQTSCSSGFKGLVLVYLSFGPTLPTLPILIFLVVSTYLSYFTNKVALIKLLAFLHLNKTKLGIYLMRPRAINLVPNFNAEEDYLRDPSKWNAEPTRY